MIKTSEVIDYIEKIFDIKLMNFQKDFLKHIIKGETIYTPKCFGRSMIYNGYADYLKNVIGKEVDYSLNPEDYDKIYTYKDILNDGSYQNIKNKKESFKGFDNLYD